MGLIDYQHIHLAKEKISVEIISMNYSENKKTNNFKKI
jgi:hypothetical protein